MGMHHQMSSNQTLQASMNHSPIRPPHFSPTKTFTKDDEIEAIKIVKHPIMRHHRSGGGHDIRKLREIYTNKKGPLHHSSTSGLFSPNYNDETQSESEHSMEVDSVEQIEDAVADVVQFLLGHFDEAPSNSVNDGGEEYESADAPEENILGNIYASYGHLLEQSNEEFVEPEIDLNPLNPPKEAEIPVVIIDDEKVPIQKPLKKFNREDGEISKSSSPEIITIDDSDDDDCIIEIYDPTPKARYKGQTALGLDLYLNNLGKNVEASSFAALEPLGIFFDMKLFYQNYETILSQLLNENEERTKYAHGILDRIFDKCVSLPIYFLLSGDVLEETRADDEFSEIQIFIASVSEGKDINVSTLMEPIFNSIKDSNIGNMTFCSDTNVIVIFQNQNTIALRPLDKLAWARSSLIYACGNKVGVYKSALLLIKKAIRQFKPAEDLSDFIISFALIHYFQQIEVFPVFDYDLDEIEFYAAVDVEVLKQPTKKANEIFSDFLFFIKHNEDITLECPFTKEQFDIKDTQLLNTIDLILGK
uniref:Uncharacterized protein n=1 Tax=Panagrolaimus davidi TaxID=227884 RepID=A0A914QEP6_9BILA